MTLVVMADGGWLRLAGNLVVARGGALDPVAPDVDETVVAAVPGTEVSVRWVDLPAMPRAQAAAAARLLAAEFAAEPVADLHVAVGPPDAAGRRAVAVTRADGLAVRLAALAERGLDPDALVPEALLLHAPPTGLVAYTRGEVVLIRGPETALAVEPALVDAVATTPPVELGAAAFEAGLPDALVAIPVDLSQGAFARRRAWVPERAQLRRLARMAAALALLVLAVPVAELVQLRLAAARDTATLQSVARAALPGAPRIANAPAQLAERVAELRGGGLGYSATMGALFAATLDTPDARLDAAAFDRDGVARATLSAASAAGLAQVADAVRARGLVADLGPARTDAGRQSAELAVRAP